MPTISIDELEIFAYADALDANTPPCKVAPIFRFKCEKDKFVFPPFRLIEDQVVNPTIGNIQDLHRMLAEVSATKLPEPIPARPNSVLWIENGTVANYEDRHSQLKKWRERAAQSFNVAKDAFESGDFQRAQSQAREAFALDERMLDALALQAAADVESGDNDGKESLKAIASQLFDARAFDDHLNAFSSRNRMHTSRNIAKLEPAYSLVGE